MILGTTPKLRTAGIVSSRANMEYMRPCLKDKMKPKMALACLLSPLI